jgi:hypothetical protein
MLLEFLEMMPSGGERSLLLESKYIVSVFPWRIEGEDAGEYCRIAMVNGASFLVTEDFPDLHKLLDNLEDEKNENS